MIQNPGWQFYQWNLKNFPYADVPQPVRALLLNPNVHYNLKSDVARWALLSLYGGVYADHDVECLKPMDCFLKHDIFAGICYEPQWIGNAVFGATKGHQILNQTAIRLTDTILEDVERANLDPIKYCVDIQTTALLSEDVTKCFREIFYPFKWDEVGRGKVFENCKEKFPRSYCAHHWSGVLPDGWIFETIHKDEDRFKFFPQLRPKTGEQQKDTKRILTASPDTIRPGSIPAIIHRVWIGDNPLPEETERFIENEKRHCQGYKHLLWKTENLEDIYALMLPDSVRMLKDETPNNVIKSDIARYELLRLFGGIYLDTDVDVLRSFDELRNTSFFCGREHGGKIGSAVLGSIPYHPITRRMSEQIWSNYYMLGRAPANSYEQLLMCGPYLLTDTVKQFKDIVVYPPDVLYPMPFWDYNSTIHFFVGGKTKAGWTHQLPEENTCDNPTE